MSTTSISSVQGDGNVLSAGIFSPGFLNKTCSLGSDWNDKLAGAIDELWGEVNSQLATSLTVWGNGGWVSMLLSRLSEL